MSGKGLRRYTRKKLRGAFGDNCYWCNKPMEFPKRGELAKNIEKLATIEHHIAKQKGDKKQMLFLRLAHKGCNI